MKNLVLNILGYSLSLSLSLGLMSFLPLLLFGRDREIPEDPIVGKILLYSFFIIGFALFCYTINYALTKEQWLKKS
jgi:drug/metabolite transporter (DMT)-like permease